MRQSELQTKIDRFLERKTLQHPDIQRYAKDVRKLDRITRY
jgi:hypothetical protein